MLRYTILLMVVLGMLSRLVVVVMAIGINNRGGMRGCGGRGSTAARGTAHV